MKKTGNFGKNARILALCGAALFATAAHAQNTVITADKMVDVLDRQGGRVSSHFRGRRRAHHQQ
jgi:uncharacterized membrane protein